LLETIVFPSKSFLSQMILQWHKSLESFYESIEGNRLEPMVESKSVWFLERIDFASKWTMVPAEDRATIISYFKGLNKLARNYAMLKSSEMASFVAAQAAASSIRLPEMPADAKAQAEWAVRVT
jgi:hypothetical protein